MVGDQSLLVEAFFVRRPDENAAEFYRFLLERNGRMYGVHFAIDSKGDVYLIGRLPLLAVTPDEIDRLRRAYADDSLKQPVLRRDVRRRDCEIGFAASIRREWDWRASRQESVENLRAFARFADSGDLPACYAWRTRHRRSTARLPHPSRTRRDPSKRALSRSGKLAHADGRSDVAARTLVLLRHGESQWNAKNLFTGWVDVDLSAKGEAEAANGGRLLAERGVRPDVVHTSLLTRAIRTANIALDAADLLWLPVQRKLAAERTALRGAARQGQEGHAGDLRRRAVHAVAPLVRRAATADCDDDEFSQHAMCDTRTLPPELRPTTECLKDVVERMLPYWYDAIVPDLQRARPCSWSRTGIRCGHW